jgi:hypothetical protein
MVFVPSPASGRLRPGGEALAETYLVAPKIIAIAWQKVMLQLHSIHTWKGSLMCFLGRFSPWTHGIKGARPHDDQKWVRFAKNLDAGGPRAAFKAVCAIWLVS